MKIRNIYFKKGIPFFCLTIAALCIIVTLISQLIVSTYMAFLFVYPIKYPWQVITHIFLQGAPQALIPPEYPSDYGIRLTIGHLGYNLLLILPFGILVEKIIGTKKMLPIFVASWLIDLIACIIMGVYFTKKGEEFGCHGASGLAFCFVPIALYAIFVLGKKYGFGKLFKQVSFYFLIPFSLLTLFIAVSPFVAGVPSMIIHLSAIIIGVIFTVVYRKTINSFFDGYH